MALPPNLLKSQQLGGCSQKYDYPSHVQRDGCTTQGRGYKNREEARVWANEAARTKLVILAGIYLKISDS